MFKIPKRNTNDENVVIVTIRLTLVVRYKWFWVSNTVLSHLFTEIIHENSFYLEIDVPIKPRGKLEVNADAAIQHII